MFLSKRAVLVDIWSRRGRHRGCTIDLVSPTSLVHPPPLGFRQPLVLDQLADFTAELVRLGGGVVREKQMLDIAGVDEFPDHLDSQFIQGVLHVSYGTGHLGIGNSRLTTHDWTCGGRW